MRAGWVMFMCAHAYDVALYGNTVKNVALELFDWLATPEIAFGDISLVFSLCSTRQVCLRPRSCCGKESLI